MRREIKNGNRREKSKMAIEERNQGQKSDHIPDKPIQVQKIKNA